MMSGGLRLFKLFGINVYAHWSFAVLLALIAWQHYAQAPKGAEIQQALVGCAFTLALFTCVVMHEYGHALMARRFGIRTRDISIQIVGGVARLEGSPTTATQELLIAIAGPMVNVVIVGVLLPIVLILGGQELVKHVRFAGSDFLLNLLLANATLVVFNMIPAFPMDGGRVLRALLWYVAGYERATLIAARVGQVVAIGFIGLGLYGATHPVIFRGGVGTYPLVLIGMFVFMAAGDELRMARALAANRAAIDALGAFRARDAMITTCAVFESGTPVSLVLDAARQTGQMDFPVIDEKSLAVGVLHRGQLQAAARIAGDTRLAEIAMRLPEPTGSDDPLSVVATRMNAWGTPAIPVVDGQTVVGMVTVEGIQRLADVRSGGPA